MPDASPGLIPYENYVGAILGGQLRLGYLIRQDLEGDVYSTLPLNGDAPNLEAKAFALGGGLSGCDCYATRKKGMDKLSKRVCSIDQAGRTFIIYQQDEDLRETKDRVQDLQPESSMIWQIDSLEKARDVQDPEVQSQSSMEQRASPQLADGIASVLEQEPPKTRNKHKKRNRGLKKSKIPSFKSFEELDWFLLDFSLRLATRQKRLDRI